MRPQSGYYNDLFEEASALLESLAVNHPFINGNKRVAFLSVYDFLKLNGYRLMCDNDIADCFIRGILTNRENRLLRIRMWLKDNTTPLC